MHLGLSEISEMIVYFYVVVFFFLHHNDDSIELCQTYHLCLSPGTMSRVCKRALISTDYAHKVLLVGDSLFEAFPPVQRVQSSIICPRCHRRCHNTIMRLLHTFSGDSRGSLLKLVRWGYDGTISQACNECSSVVQSGRQRSGARTAQKPQGADFYAQKHRFRNKASRLLELQLFISVVYWWVEAPLFSFLEMSLPHIYIIKSAGH